MRAEARSKPDDEGCSLQLLFCLPPIRSSRNWIRFDSIDSQGGGRDSGSHARKRPCRAGTTGSVVSCVWLVRAIKTPKEKKDRYCCPQRSTWRVGERAAESMSDDYERINLNLNLAYESEGNATRATAILLVG